MADEFTPEASVDFEALAAMASEISNGDGPHLTPPPDQPAGPTPPPIRPRQRSATPPPATSPSLGLDPFQALEKIVGDQSLMYRELGDINTKLAIIQLQTIIAFGAAALLAVLIWKFSKAAS